MPFGRELSHLIEEQINRAVEVKTAPTAENGTVARSGGDEGRIAQLEANLQRLAESFTNFLGAQKKNKRDMIDYGLAVVALQGMRVAVTSGRVIFVEHDEPLVVPYTYLELSGAGTERQIRYIYLDNTGVVLESSSDPTNIGKGYIPLAMIDVWGGVKEITQDKIKDIRPRAGADELNQDAQKYQELTGNVSVYSPDTGNDSFIVSVVNPASLKVNVTAGRALIAGEMISAAGGLLDLTNHRNVTKEFISFSDEKVKTYNLFHKSVANVVVYVDDTVTPVTIDADNGAITFTAAPPAGAKITASYTFSGNYLLVFMVERTQTNDGTPFGVINWQVGSSRTPAKPPALTAYQHAIAKVDMSASITAITDAIIDNSYEVANLTQYDLQYGGKLDGTSLKAGAVTADKIAAGSINAAKIVTGAIQASHIATGTIQANHIAAGAVNASHIAANTIKGEMLQSGTITGDKINAASLRVLDDLSKASGTGLALNAQGMKIMESGGSYTMFDANGITWFSKANIPFGAVRRVVAGTCPNGRYVRLNWERTPFILLSPKNVQTTVSGYTSSDIQVVCEPFNISPTGFNVRLETRLQNGNSISLINTQLKSESRFPTSGIIQTTPALCTGISVSCNVMTYDYHGNKNDYYGHATIHCYYRKSGSNSWIDGGTIEARGPDRQTITYSRNLASGLPAAQYDVRLCLDRGNQFEAYWSTLTTTGGGVIASNGEVNFIAIETDGRAYYSIE